MAKATELGTAMDIAAVHAGANQKALVRMVGAWLGSIGIAQRMAPTARYSYMETGVVGQLSQPGGPLHQIEVPTAGVITFPGSVPTRDRDGTISVSGSTVDHDYAVAQAGAAALS